MAASVLCLAALLLAFSLVDASGTARATFYGTDAWSIHTGSCQFGYLDEGVSTGWDVAAMSDANPDYTNSCGKCKEVKCKPIDFADGYGSKLERRGVCYNPDAAVVVMVTDTCPCSYPGNAYSNKRWCCGDMYHLDLSHWAFEKLADTKWGVIALETRDVPCNHKPRVVARRPDGGKTAMPSQYSAPANWRRSMDKRLRMG